MSDPPTLPIGSPPERWPALGLGTWRLGEQPSQANDEVALLRDAVEIGYRLFDTAEMYGEGGAELVLGRALNEAMSAQGVARERLHIVSKAYPHHADVPGLRRACDASRRRLQLDTIDLYLLHWRGEVPLAETLEGLERLRLAGHIRHWGVSNFDLADMQELARLQRATSCTTNQVYYSLTERGVEFDLLPWMRTHKMPLMAYCPIDGGRIVRDAALNQLAASNGVSAARLALGWLMHQPGVMAIPKAGRKAHLLENWQSQLDDLPDTTWAALDTLFPAPKRRTALAMR